MNIMIYLILIWFPAISSIHKTNLTPDDFVISLHRQYLSNKCTSGYIAVNGKITCYSLERSWRNNQTNLSSIPAGKYNANLRYDHTDNWRIELKNVPKRTNVQIHIGNQVDDSKGCILVGAKLSKDLCSISESAKAYKILKSSFYGSETPVSTPDKSIIIEIMDETY